MIKDIFNKEEAGILRKLSTPIKIQDFLDTMPRNMEKHGDTLMSPRRVLAERKAHCIEAALLAATALWFHGHKPLVIDLRASREDYDHVVAIYRKNGYFGAISKTNHVGLRFRDPVYKTVRELAMSYFHEYLHDHNDHKTLRAYSGPVNLAKFGKKWLTADDDLFDLALAIDGAKHCPVAPKDNLRQLRHVDRMEHKANRLVEWHKLDPRT
jgi:hypothetical protein